jgi:hypothetical protein
LAESWTLAVLLLLLVLRLPLLRLVPQQLVPQQRVLPLLRRRLLLLLSLLPRSGAEVAHAKCPQRLRQNMRRQKKQQRRRIEATTKAQVRNRME